MRVESESGRVRVGVGVEVGMEGSEGGTVESAKVGVEYEGRGECKDGK